MVLSAVMGGSPNKAKRFNIAKSMSAKGKKNEEELAHKALRLNAFDMWCLGMTIVVGGQYFSWNAALGAGFGSCIIVMLLIGSAYACLCMCNAELTSSMPFAGGAYGLARVSLGLLPGFVVGCCETVEYIVYVSSAALSLGTMIQEASHVDANLTPIFCLIFYFVSTSMNIIGGRMFWYLNAVIGVVSLLLVLIYCFGSLKWVDAANLTDPRTTGHTERAMFIGGMRSFMAVLPLGGWMYVGVEALNLATSIVIEVC
jgi:ethanolamine permease